MDIFEGYKPLASVDEAQRPETLIDPTEVDDRPLWQQFTRYRFCSMLDAVWRWDIAYHWDGRCIVYEIWRNSVKEPAIRAVVERLGGIENVPIQPEFSAKYPRYEGKVMGNPQVPAGEYTPRV